MTTGCPVRVPTKSCAINARKLKSNRYQWRDYLNIYLSLQVLAVCIAIYLTPNYSLLGTGHHNKTNLGKSKTSTNFFSADAYYEILCYSCQEGADDVDEILLKQFIYFKWNNAPEQ